MAHIDYQSIDEYYYGVWMEVLGCETRKRELTEERIFWYGTLSRAGLVKIQSRMRNIGASLEEEVVLLGRVDFSPTSHFWSAVPSSPILI